MEKVILVDEKNNEVGVEEKISVHRMGKLHRAFSVLIYNSKGEMLLQKRALSKYHCGGLWANAACSHPRLGESIDYAAHRRLKEEMGLDCPLEKKFSFVYRADFGEMIEHEFDQVFVGEYNGKVFLNLDEVEDYAWVSLVELRKDAVVNPQKYTPWFLKILERVEE